MVKYFIILLICLFYCTELQAQTSNICVTDKEVVELITLLDASERDIKLLGSCKLLVKDLYKEIDNRDIKVETLTKELISAKQDSLTYLASSKRWRVIALSTSVSTIALLLIISAL